MKVLCVHGVGQHDPRDPVWQQAWKAALGTALGNEVQCEFCMHDELFEHSGLGLLDTANAIRTLGGSFFTPRTRGLFDGDNIVGWTAGMVTQWAGKPELRRQAREKLAAQIKQFKPDVIAAHSLGSIIAYDLFATTPSAVDGRAFVSFGSQINNRFVQGVFTGGVRPLTASALWLHFFNPNDWVFTAEIGLNREKAQNFAQFTVAFNEGWIGSHTNLQKYLASPPALAGWQVFKDWKQTDIPRTRSLGTFRADAGLLAAAATGPARAHHNQRALLIGINEYTSSLAPTLDGCANDVFLVSEVLQESGFAPEDIRVVLNDRATKEGIIQRMEWLFDDVRDDDVRVLYFSGHGVKLPAYNEQDEPDHMVEALVPHDFDGSQTSAITDRDLARFYSNAPLEAWVMMIFDCCSAGGLSVDGRNRGGRGVDLPDDIRHRMLRWDATEKMWVRREFPPLIPDESWSGAESTAAAEQWRQSFVGQDGCTERLGRSNTRRGMKAAEYDKVRKDTGWSGPHLPMMLEACKEDELAEEYLHGQSAYGVFTYAFAQAYRETIGEQSQKRKKVKKLPSFRQLVDATRAKINRLGYLQQPQIVGPQKLLDSEIPLLVAPKRKK